MLSLQLFLVVISLPLMFLAALIAERRARTNVLRESEARFRSMADTAPVLIWMSGPDKRCSFLNKTWLDFTGRTPEQELGNGWAEGVHPDDRERCLADYVNAFDARREFTKEYRLRRHDGKYGWVSDKGVPRLAPDGTFLGYIGCADDITQRKLAEAEAAQFRERLAHLVRVHTAGEMSAALAHEINQPLGAIENYALAARRRMGEASPDLARVADLLDKVIGQATRAGDVVTRMRGMVQRHELEPKEIDVARAVRECVDMVKMDCEVRDIRIELKRGRRVAGGRGRRDPSPAGDPQPPAQRHGGGRTSAPRHLEGDRGRDRTRRSRRGVGAGRRPGRRASPRATSSACSNRSTRPSRAAWGSAWQSAAS